MKGRQPFRTKEISWTNDKFSESKNKFIYGKKKTSDEWFFCQFRSYKNWNSNLQDRLTKLKKIDPFDHFITVREISKGQNDNSYLIFTQCFHQSIPLKKFITEASEHITVSKMKYIAFHIVRALMHLESNKLAHLNLTPSAVFVHPKEIQKINENLKLIAKVGKVGCETGDYQRYKEYFHPDIIEQKVDPFVLAGGTNQTFIYDAWSFSVIIYHMLKGQLPFINQQKKYDFSRARKYCDGSYNLLDEADQNDFLNSIIQRCMNRSENEKFNSWKQVYTQFVKEGFASKIQLKPIRNTYESQIRVMYLFSQIFMLVIKNMQIPLRNFWKEETRLASFLWGIVHLCQYYHLKEFKKFFLPLCTILPPKETKFYEEISACISIEKKASEEYRPPRYQPQPHESLSSFLETYQKIIMGIKIQLDDIKDKEKSLGIFSKFLDELLGCLKKMKDLEKDQKSHREDMIAVIIESENFKRMAIDVFHFIFPPQKL